MKSKSLFALIALAIGSTSAHAEEGSPTFGAAGGGYFADELQATGVASEFYVAGHSVGGSMSWYTACYQGDRFAAFGPSSGGYWLPEPTTCPSGPVHLRHSHGRIDTFVPLEGRALRRGDIAQANIFEGLERWRVHGGCSGEQTVSVEGPYTCEQAVDCVGSVQLCLYEGRHPKPDGWETHLAAWFDAVGR